MKGKIKIDSTTGEDYVRHKIIFVCISIMYYHIDTIDTDSFVCFMSGITTGHYEEKN